MINHKALKINYLMMINILEIIKNIYAVKLSLIFKGIII